MEYTHFVRAVVVMAVYDEAKGKDQNRGTRPLGGRNELFVRD